ALQDADDATLRRSTHVTRLLRSLAYEPAQFERAVVLLIKFVQLPQSGGARDSEATSIVTSLFQILLSGTHAPVTMRLNVLGALLLSNDIGLRTIGMKALEAMLQSSHFSSS